MKHNLITYGNKMVNKLLGRVYICKSDINGVIINVFRYTARRMRRKYNENRCNVPSAAPILSKNN